MATIPLRAMSAVKTTNSDQPFALTFPEAASQTFKQGAILTFDGSGKIIEASTDPVRIVGIAAADASNDSTGLSVTLVWVAHPDTVYMANKMLTGVASATVQTDIGRDFGLVKVGNNWFLDQDLGTHARRAICIDLDRRDNLGDIGGRLHFQFFSQFAVLFHTS